MKFRNFGRVSLALVASVVLAFGTQSCNYNYTNAYIIVLGSQYNQVASYKENNDTGGLVPAPHDPQSSNGSNPVRAVLLTGGRYVYVLNQGTPKYDSAGNITWSGGGIAIFSIGGDGSLSYQLSYPSQGNGSKRLLLSLNSGFLYVLDQYQPGTSALQTPGSPTQSAAYPCYDPTYKVYRPAGDITAFQIDSSTGRLFLVQNQQQQNAQGTPLSYFPIGCGPIDFHLASNFIYTAEASDPATGNQQVVYAYATNGSSGQLTQVPGGAQPISGATNIGVIGGSGDGKWVYILDNGTNQIFTFEPGTNGLLTATSIPSIANASTAAGMTALTTDSNSRYLYVTNTVSTGLNQTSSQLSIFNITAGSGVLTPASQPTYGTGSTPVCVFEDTSHQYVYTANAGSSDMTGAHFDPNTGVLTNLPKGSTFKVIGTPTWCLYSSNTN
ncbi:MAG TPA: beta-propeller fold lactonase family protein [Acidobacteriaceae bacterium]|nr:beta-propeller fold lactonase family protein [Acidobacteriaceae bacterium]